MSLLQAAAYIYLTSGKTFLHFPLSITLSRRISSYIASQACSFVFFIRSSSHLLQFIMMLSTSKYCQNDDLDTQFAHVNHLNKKLEQLDAEMLSLSRDQVQRNNHSKLVIEKVEFEKVREEIVKVST